MKYLFYILFLVIIILTSLAFSDGIGFQVGYLINSITLIIANSVIVISLYKLSYETGKTTEASDKKYWLFLLVPVAISASIAILSQDEFGFFLNGASTATSTIGSIFLAIYFFNILKGSYSPESLDDTPPSGIQLTISALRARAARLKYQSFGFLTIIMALLITAGFSIVYAGYLTEFDKYSADALRTAIDERDKIDSRIDSVRKQLSELQVNSNSSSYLSEINLQNRLSRLQEDYDYINDEISSLKSERNGENNTNGNAFSDKSFLSTASIRFGVTIIILFFVQVLVNLYKYNIRLSAYYEAKADALLISNGDLELFEKLSNNMSPNELHFGKAESTPIDKLIDMATKINKSNTSPPN